MKINGIDVIESFIPTSNKTSRPGYSMDPKYITVHNTGNSKQGADARANSNFAHNTSGYVSWHFTVDDKSIYQILPTDEVAWHAGDGNGDGNRKSIGIEICENVDGDYQKAEDNAIALIVNLMKEHNIPLNNVVPHQHWSGKYCPHKILNYGWDKFLERIKKAMANETEQKVSQWAVEAQVWVQENGISDGEYPKDVVTREQLWTMLYRANKLK